MAKSMFSKVLREGRRAGIFVQQHNQHCFGFFSMRTGKPISTWYESDGISPFGALHKAITIDRQDQPKPPTVQQRVKLANTLLDAHDVIGRFDGSCTPKNPGGTGGWGYVLKEASLDTPWGSLNVLHSDRGKLPAGPDMSNNVAEYRAAGNLLMRVAGFLKEGSSVKVEGDSDLVIKQMTGKWRVKGGLYVGEYHRTKAALDALEAKGVIVDFAWIPRSENTEADSLSTA